MEEYIQSWRQITKPYAKALSCVPLKTANFWWNWKQNIPLTWLIPKISIFGYFFTSLFRVHISWTLSLRSSLYNAILFQTSIRFISALVRGSPTPNVTFQIDAITPQFHVCGSNFDALALFLEDLYLIL